MFPIYCIVFLYVINNIPITGALVTDYTCFEEKSKLVMNRISKNEDPEFHRDLERLKGSPFTLTVRYCLGKDGDKSSRDFIRCVSSMSSCSITWYSIVNWQYCLCNTAHCVLKGCVQHWLSTFDFTDTKVSLDLLTFFSALPTAGSLLCHVFSNRLEDFLFLSEFRHFNSHTKNL